MGAVVSEWYRHSHGSSRTFDVCILDLSLAIQNNDVEWGTKRAKHGNFGHNICLLTRASLAFIARWSHTTVIKVTIEEMPLPPLSNIQKFQNSCDRIDFVSAGCVGAVERLRLSSSHHTTNP